MHADTLLPCGWRGENRMVKEGTDECGLSKPTRFSHGVDVFVFLTAPSHQLTGTGEATGENVQTGVMRENLLISNIHTP